MIDQAALTAMPPDLASENKGPRTLAIVWSFNMVASLCVVGRIWSRLMKLHRLGLDDCLVLVSLVSVLHFKPFQISR